MQIRAHYEIQQFTTTDRRRSPLSSACYSHHLAEMMRLINVNKLVQLTQGLISPAMHGQLRRLYLE